MSPWRRRSIRLSGYDYRSPGAYFVTICTYGREMLLEALEVREMVMGWWREIPAKYLATQVDAFVVMPNHIHGVVVLVGATRSGRPEDGQPHRVAPTLGDVVGWFKARTTNAYIRGVKELGWEPFAGRLWHRNYYEHVIRDEASRNRIRQYILDNPARWAYDRDNPSGQPDKEETRFWEELGL